jgi:hypothetical protein
MHLFNILENDYLFASLPGVDFLVDFLYLNGFSRAYILELYDNNWQVA